MDYTLKSANDLLKIYAPHTATHASQIVPTLIYSGSRNGTFQVMKVINEARNTKLHEYDPTDMLIQWFHSCTAKGDKISNMEDFSNELFPVILTTMALGLGQNLKRVRCVIHLGRGDPSSIVQMVGRCGRGGNGGLALLFMEPTRKKGKNCIADFDPNNMGGDDTRMDSLEVTPLCLRVALTCNNRYVTQPLYV
jgi:superfamily II DNA helicase RecQ